MASLSFDRRLPIIPVQVIIFGRRGLFEVNLVVDTGATYTLISKNTASILGLASLVVKEVEISTVSRVEKAPLVVVPKISFLELTAYDIECLVMDLPGEDEFVHGLLGLSFLKNFELRINFPKGILELK